MIKVAIDITQIIHKGTGVANYVRNLCIHLAKNRDISLVLFGYSYSKFNELLNFTNDIKRINQTVEVKLFKIPERFFNILWNTLHIIAVERLIGPVDIIHTSDWIEPPSHAPKVTTIHDLIIYKYSDTSHPYIIKTQSKKLAWVKKETETIFADSETTKKDIVDLLKISSEKIKVVYPGLDKDIYPRGNHIIVGVEKRYKIRGDYILSVGTQEPRKNLKAAIDAFTLYQQHPLVQIKKPPVELIIIGKYGWGEGAYVPPGVRNIGFIETRELSALYSGSLMLVYTSLYEGFGFPALEAMKCGCPVILSDRGSLAEIGKNAAILVNPHDVREIARQMVTLTVNKKQRDQWREKGLKNAEKYKWESAIDKIISHYKKIA